MKHFLHDVVVDAVVVVVVIDDMLDAHRAALFVTCRQFVTKGGDALRRVVRLDYDRLPFYFRCP